MERDPNEGGTDVGRDIVRDLADEPPPAIRDAPPDILSPIDETSPVSGHMPPPESAGSAVDSPEHDWGLARALVRPAFRPVGTSRPPDRDGRSRTRSRSTRCRATPSRCSTWARPGCRWSTRCRPSGFDIVVNGDHLLSWGIEPSELQDAAMANLGAWAASAPWTDEADGDRRLISSDTGDGLDAVRILLPETIEHLTRELGGDGRVLVGHPGAPRARRGGAASR